MSRFASPLAAAVALLTWQARAESLNISVVREDGAESCPDAVHVRAAVMHYLSRPQHQEAGAIEVRMTPSGDGAFAATVRLRSATGQSMGVRQFSESTCDRLVKVVALSIALHLDPDAVATEAPPPPLKTPKTTIAPSGVPEKRLSTLSIGPVASFGLLPQTAVGMRLGADFEIVKRWNIRAGAFLLPENRTQDGRFLFGLSAFDAGLCGAIVRGDRGSVRACASGLVGELHAVVLKLEPTEPGGRLWIGANAEISGGVRIAGSLGAEATIGATVPILRQPFLIRGESTPVFQQQAFAPFARAAVTLSF